MKGQESERVIRVLVVGDSGSGKTALIRALEHQAVPPLGADAPTVGCAITVLEHRVRPGDGAALMVECWEVGGHDAFRPARAVLYREREFDACIVVADSTSESTQASQRWWVDELSSRAPFSWGVDSFRADSADLEASLPLPVPSTLGILHGSQGAPDGRIRWVRRLSGEIPLLCVATKADRLLDAARRQSEDSGAVGLVMSCVDPFRHLPVFHQLFDLAWDNKKEGSPSAWAPVVLNRGPLDSALGTRSRYGTGLGEVGGHGEGGAGWNGAAEGTSGVTGRAGGTTMPGRTAPGAGAALESDGTSSSSSSSPPRPRLLSGRSKDSFSAAACDEGQQQRAASGPPIPLNKAKEL
eukprot:CAMPEP_0118981010 /NCGR_PEP_ID=MMETSP1173-20130426/29666_1 /TAXON_ID=1034831 /ORGANISM="Rhizochromulina marina cf, Strain CCMP1243" /LENGTH=353 /DNA_ID=CAMNT_0006931399 /DNA_START=44 /DNA_END=1105 /DNA_ORIENTATION=+